MQNTNLDTLSAGLASSQKLTDALKLAVDIATNGYIADDERVATAIQEDKDARTQQITDLTNAIKSKDDEIIIKDAKIAELQALLDQANNPPKP